jgi:toluene monooxygenase system protein D
VLQAGEIATAVVDAIRMDNPGMDVDLVDRGSYIRVHTVGRCRLTRQSLEEVLGRPIELSEIEPVLASFAGRISTGSEEIVWREGGS